MTKTVFDLQQYTVISQKRAQWLNDLLTALLKIDHMNTAIDVGCGTGDFSRLLYEMEMKVVGIDGRASNVAEAQTRLPAITFRVGNIEEDQSIQFRSSSFDLVLCLGLLYHLENPFRAIRNLHALSARHLIIETRIAPSNLPTAILLDEFSHAEDQGLNYIALIPSESCFVRMLYAAGFKNVYSVRFLPDHPEFKKSIMRKQMRACWVASKTDIDLPALLKWVPDKRYQINWWQPLWYRKLRQILGALRKHKIPLV